MRNGGHGNPDVMGMMYWTTTGVTGNIRNRNTGMWSPPNVSRLKQLWTDGLEEAIESGKNRHRQGLSDGGACIKAFMPNIVMIDFADKIKCDHVFELNTHSPTFLVENIGNFDEQ